MQGLAAPEQGDVEERRGDMPVETSAGAFHQDALPGRPEQPPRFSLRETKAGRMINLMPPPEEEEGERREGGGEEEREEVGPGPP